MDPQADALFTRLRAGRFSDFRGARAEATNGLPVKAEWVGARPEHCVVIRTDSLLILEHELPHHRGPLHLPGRIKVWDVPNDEVVAVDGQGEAPFEQRLQVRITTRQCL